ncbi:DUF1488 family protein [Paraburkholderia sediminicola]
MADRSGIDFWLPEAIGFTLYAVTREALEVHFWLSPQADENRMLKMFYDGRNRIVALAERKMRGRPGHPVRLACHDFIAGR